MGWVGSWYGLVWSGQNSEAEFNTVSQWVTKVGIELLGQLKNRDEDNDSDKADQGSPRQSKADQGRPRQSKQTKAHIQVSSKAIKQRPKKSKISGRQTFTRKNFPDEARQSFPRHICQKCVIRFHDKNAKSCW